MDDELEGVFPLHQPTFIPCSSVCVCARACVLAFVDVGGWARAHLSPLVLDLYNIYFSF
jgi:hypothetical protein